MNNDPNKILIIDDSVTNLQVIERILSKENYQIYTAESAAEALDILNEGNIPQLIILDLMMPEIDGFEFKRRLNENNIWNQIPVIVISALVEQNYKAQAFDLGCVDFMIKPFHKEEVATRVGLHLKLSEQREKLEKANSQLNEANKTRDRIFSIISHDLRTSVGNIRNVFQFMIDGLIDPEEDKDLILDAEITSRNTYNLLDNLLYWAKSQQGQIVFTPELVNVSRIVSSISEMEKGSMLNKNISFVESIDPNLFVWSDKILFTIIIRNLIANAIKFTNPGGRISAVATKSGKDVKISIIDNGIGIDEENIKKLKKNQVFTTIGTNNEKGTGLGLVLVKDCINRCKGKFDVKSKIKVGSEFIVSLPGEKE